VVCKDNRAQHLHDVTHVFSNSVFSFIKYCDLSTVSGMCNLIIINGVIDALHLVTLGSVLAAFSRMQLAGSIFCNSQRCACDQHRSISAHAAERGVPGRCSLANATGAGPGCPAWRCLDQCSTSAAHAPRVNLRLSENPQDVAGFPASSSAA
jgi:hypothetical protein